MYHLWWRMRGREEKAKVKKWYSMNNQSWVIDTSSKEFILVSGTASVPLKKWMIGTKKYAINFYQKICLGHFHKMAYASYVKLVHSLCDWLCRLNWHLSSNYLHPPQSVTAWHGTLPEECQKGHFVGWWEAGEKDPLGFLMQMMHSAEKSQRGSRTPTGRFKCVCVASVIPLAFSLMLRKGKQNHSWWKGICLTGPRPKSPLPSQGQMFIRALELSTSNFRSKHSVKRSCGQGISMTLVNQMTLGLHHSTPFSHCGTTGTLGKLNVNVLIWSKMEA